MRSGVSPLVRGIASNGLRWAAPGALCVALLGLGAAVAAGRLAVPDTGIWRTRAPLPVAESEVGVASVGGKVYVVGGSEEPPVDATAAVFRYDPATDRWSRRAPLPVAASHIAVTALGGRIYAFGGFRDAIHLGPLNRAFVYDPATDRWTELPPMPSARGSIAAAAVGDQIHLFGGRLSDRVVTFQPPGGPPMRLGLGTVTSHDIFDVRTGKWSTGPAIPGPSRDHLGIAVLDGKIHLFGGRINDFSDLLERHDVYDPATRSWRTAAPLPEKRSAGAYAVARGRILYAGGECKPGGQPYTPNTFEAVDAYDPRTDRWVALAPLPRGRQAFGAATVGRTVYFAAGAYPCGGGSSTDMTALTLP